MKFASKITQLLIGTTVGSTVMLSWLFVELKPLHTKAAVAQIAQALSPEEVNLRAKPIIVRIDGAGTGSGSIIKHTNNLYTVLTNWHVTKNPGDYVVQTIDGRTHQVDPASIQQLPGLDLAILKFNSDQNYQTAEMGDSSNLSEGQNVYFAGYPGELRTEDNRYYRFFTANLVGILPKARENGYSLVYSGEAFPGMSGGPVFNQNGLMIGVHGEANINAISGGTSNYAIPINSYQQAIAKLNTQPEVTQQPAAASPPPAETNSTPEPAAESTNSENISSVPTFSAEPPPETSNSEAEQQPAAESPEVTQPEPEPPAAVEPEPEVTQPAAESESEEIAIPTTTRKITLISQQTGIDYTKLRNLLREKKWSEADLHTYQLVEQIVKTAKQQNQHLFIELNTIAEFSCPDIRTVDHLWKKYSNDKFGFSPQQEAWQSVNQQGDFSTQTWRRFATKVGWKKGEVVNGTGYLLYDELDFEPSQAPAGHLPWWFALPDEEQNVIKSLFARCNLNPTAQELEAEARENSSNAANNQPNINKKPKSPNDKPADS
ncbi:MAG: GUN4 domain-containing protein [Pleurocapsa sp.]